VPREADRHANTCFHSDGANAHVSIMLFAHRRSISKPLGKIRLQIWSSCPCSWGAFLPNSGSLSLLLGCISRNYQILSLLLECISRSGACGDIAGGYVGNYSPEFGPQGNYSKITQKLLPEVKIIQKLLKNYSKITPPISALPEITRRYGGARASN